MCLSRTSDHILINLDQLLDKIFGHISRSILWRKVWTQFFSKMLSQIVVLECWSKFANQFWTKHWLKFMSSFWSKILSKFCSKDWLIIMSNNFVKKWSKISVLNSVQTFCLKIGPKYQSKTFSKIVAIILVQKLVQKCAPKIIKKVSPKLSKN